jgi:hypothetical protein
VRVTKQKIRPRCAVERAKNRCKRNALPLAGEITQPSQQRFTLVAGAELGFALDFFA